MKQKPRFVRRQPEMLDARLRVDREKAGHPVCVYLVFVSAIKCAGLGIRGKRPVGEHIDAIAARNAARVDQPVFVRPVAEPEEAGVVRYNAFYVHPEPVALHDAGNAAARTRSVHILVNATHPAEPECGKSGLRRPVRVHQAIRCPLRRPAS